MLDAKTLRACDSRFGSCQQPRASRRTGFPNFATDFPGSSSIGNCTKGPKACNDIMNHFTRWPGDETDGSLSRVLRKCRDISQTVLGSLDSKGISKTITHDPNCAPDAKIWAIGHWYVLSQRDTCSRCQSHRYCLVVEIHAHPTKDCPELEFTV